MKLERDVARECDELAMRCGYIVCRMSQARPSKVTGGLPDRRYRNLTLGVAFWFELKKPDGQMTREQYEFLTDELRCGWLGSCGGVEELTELLQAVRGWRDDPEARAEAIDLARKQLECWRFQGFRGERKTERVRRAERKQGRAA